jgi:hypothetical protein
MTPRTRSIVASALLLLIGAAAGVVGDHLVLLHRRGVALGISAAGAASLHAQLLAELDRELHLTPVQHDSINAMLGRHQQSIDAAWRVIHGKLDAGMDSMHQELRAILQPEQLTLLRDWMGRQHMTGQ